MAESGTRAEGATPTTLAADDPFPAARFGALLRRLPAYARLGWRLGADRRLSGSRRAAVAAAVAYLASPIDLVPGIIPFAGQLDDAAVALLGLRFALRGLPLSDQAAHLRAAGVTAGDLDHDLVTVRLGAAWLVRRGVRLGGRLAERVGRLTLAGVRAAQGRLSAARTR